MEQYAEIRVKLDGWRCERRVIVTRILKPANPTPQDEFWGLDQAEFWAYVTNLDVKQATPAQSVLAYRKRGDAENVFDELKNQWGFSGFCSGKGVVQRNGRPPAVSHLQPVEPVCAGAQARGLPPRGDHQPRRPAGHAR
jgi:hypothetical protein